MKVCFLSIIWVTLMKLTTEFEVLSAIFSFRFNG